LDTVYYEQDTIVQNQKSKTLADN